MCVFEQFMENGKTVDEDFAYDCLPRNLHEYYDEMYYESALKQLKALQLSFKPFAFFNKKLFKTPN